MIPCLNTSTVVNPPNCIGKVDCANSVASVTMYNTGGAVVPELSCTQPTIIEIDFADCEGNYSRPGTIDGSGDLKITSGPNDLNSLNYLQFVSPTSNQWTYTPPPGLTTPGSVTLTWGTDDQDPLCTITLPMGLCGTVSNNIHFNTGITRIKANLNPNGQIIDFTPGPALTIENLRFDGPEEPMIDIRNKDIVVIEGNCLKGRWNVGENRGAYGQNGITVADSGEARINDNQVSNFSRSLILTRDCGSTQAARNNMFDFGFHALMVQASRQDKLSVIENNFGWFTVNDDLISGGDTFNIYNPRLTGNKVIVRNNFAYGYRGVNALGFIIDGPYTSGLANAGILIGGVDFIDNVSVDCIVGGLGLAAGGDVFVNGHCDFYDGPIPTPGGFDPSSGGLGIYCRETSNINNIGHPNFGQNMVIQNSTIYHHHRNDGFEQRFWEQISGTCSISGNNFSGSGLTPIAGPDLSREQVIAKGRANASGVPCFE